MPEQTKDTSPLFMIQVADVVSGGTVTPQMSVDEFVQGTKETLEKVGKVVAAAVDPVFEQLHGMARKPSEFGIEFGVNVGGEHGVPWVAKGTIGANFKISLKWNWGEVE
jgi:hypothetical protein